MNCYKFYRKTEDKVFPKNEYAPFLKDQFDAYDHFLKCWCNDTCAPSLRNVWNAKTNYTCGQCSITSFIIQDIFGGDVYAVKTSTGATHCFNNVNGVVFDLTSEQFFDAKLDYEDSTLQSRDDHFANQDKYNRYLLLKDLFLKEIGYKK